MLALGPQRLNPNTFTGGGMPSWVPKTNRNVAALMTLDVANNRGWFSGTAYATEAAFLAAVGGVKSGAAYTVGPYVDPAATELVTNGDLSNGTTGWAAVNGGTISVVNGEMVLEGAGGTNASAETPVIPVVVGKAYRAKAKYRKGTATNAAAVIAASSASLSPAIAGMPNNNTTTDVTNTTGFAAETATSYLALRIPATTPTGTVIGDNFSVKEASPLSGWVPAKDALVIDFVCPSANATIKTVCSLEDGLSSTSRNKTKLYVDTDGHLKIAVTTSGTLRSTTDLGAVSPGSSHSVQFTSANNRVFIALDSGLPLLISGFVTEGVYALFFGKSAIGETWDGSISKVSVFSDEYLPARAIVANGDSYVDGVAGVAVGSGMIAAGRSAVASVGLGGSDLPTQLGLLQAVPGLTNGILIQWDGDANGFGTTAADMVIYAQIVALLGHNRFVIIPSCNRANVTGSQRQATIDRSTAIRSTYPTNSYDAQAYLATLSDGSAGDIAAVAAGNIPPSCLQADGTHLTSTAMNAVMAQIVSTVITPNGW